MQSAVVQYLIHHVHELFPGDEPHAVGEVETRGILDTPGREDDYEENEAENGYWFEPAPLFCLYIINKRSKEICSATEG